MATKRQQNFERIHKALSPLQVVKDDRPDLSPLIRTARVEYEAGVVARFSDDNIETLKAWCRTIWKSTPKPYLAQIKEHGEVIWEHWHLTKK